MPYDIPPLRKLITDGEKDIAYELDLEKLPPVCVEKALNTAFSTQVRDLYDHQSWIKDQIIPSPKSEDDTIIQEAAYEGVIRKQASFALGPATFTSTAPLTADTRMQSDSNQVYSVTASGPVIDGRVTVIIKAEDAGVAGNLQEGDVLTLLSPVPGTGSTGQVASGGITGGADIEPVSELLDRLLYRKRNPPVGGALHDYVIWAREMAGVSRAWAWDMWHGPCTVGLAWLYDGREDILPTAADLTAMEHYLFRHKDPASGQYVGKPGGIEVWPVMLTLKTVPLSIRLTPDSDATRKAVQTSLLTLQKTIAPGQPLPVSSLRTAIGIAAGVTDYLLNVTADITCDVDELVTLGEITWLTAQKNG